MSIERTTSPSSISAFKKRTTFSEICKQIRIWISVFAIDHSLSGLRSTKIINACSFKSSVYLLIVRILRIQILSYPKGFVNIRYSQGGWVEGWNFGYLKSLYESNRCSNS